MPAYIEDYEIEESPTFPIENYRVEDQNQRPHQKENESPLIWKYYQLLDRSTAIDNALNKLTVNSREILKFQDDTDDGFIPYKDETLKRAINFLAPYMKALLWLSGANVPAPKLLPGPAGSIDVHWKNERKELIVNIPADPNAKALFYGDDYGEIFIKGSLGTAPLHASILMWLMSY